MKRHGRLSKVKLDYQLISLCLVISIVPLILVYILTINGIVGSTRQSIGEYSQ